MKYNLFISVVALLLIGCASTFQTVGLYNETAYQAVKQAQIETNAVVDARANPVRSPFVRSLYSRSLTSIAQAKGIYQTLAKESNSVSQLDDLSDALEGFIVLDSMGAHPAAMLRPQGDIHTIDSLIESSERAKIRPAK